MEVSTSILEPRTAGIPMPGHISIFIRFIGIIASQPAPELDFERLVGPRHVYSVRLPLRDVPAICSRSRESGFSELVNHNAKKVLSHGYKGLWIDDSNLVFRVGDGNGNFVSPRDPRTGRAMTEDAWQGYVAGFLQQIRSALPNAELVHNSIWFAGDSAQTRIRM